MFEFVLFAIGILLAFVLLLTFVDIEIEQRSKKRGRN